jgi:hypothetical protein
MAPSDYQLKVRQYQSVQTFVGNEICLSKQLPRPNSEDY